MINSLYLNPKIVEGFAQAFRDGNPRGLQITSFFDEKSYSSFLKSIKTAKFNKVEQRDMFSFYQANVDLSFFNSKEFLSFASAVTGRCITRADVSLRIFMRGSFTLMHESFDDGNIEFFFDLAPTWDNSRGGYVTLLSDTGEKVVLPNHPNSISLAFRGSSYVKYVNSSAKEEGRLMVYGVLK